jgi:hypothetical protein
MVMRLCRNRRTSDGRNGYDSPIEAVYHQSILAATGRTMGIGGITLTCDFR